MSKRSQAQERRKQRRQGNLLRSEIMGAATDLREALRPVVAFRGELEKCHTEEELQITLLEGDLPANISKALDLHQNLMLALAIGARVEAEKKGEVDLGKKIDKVVATEEEEKARAGIGIAKPPAASFLDD